MDCSVHARFNLSTLYIQASFNHHKYADLFHWKITVWKKFERKKCNLRSSHSQWVWTIDRCVYKPHNAHVAHVLIETMCKKANEPIWLTGWMNALWCMYATSNALFTFYVNFDGIIYCDDDDRLLHIYALNSSHSVDSFLAVKIHLICLTCNVDLW